MASGKKRIYTALTAAATVLAAAALCAVFALGQETLAGSPLLAAPVQAAVLPPPPVTVPPTPAATPEPEPVDVFTEPPYRFGEPLGESAPVEDSWFDDAVFLGDSRTEGLQLYSGLKTGTFFCYRGLSVFTAHTKECVIVEGKKLTLAEAMSTGTWGKVYIMFGLNELGYPVSSFKTGLVEMVRMVKQTQPQAVIYLQTLPPVNEKLAANNRYRVSNRQVAAFNEAVVQVAQAERVVLVDTAAPLSGEDGKLPGEYTADGVHFRRAGYELWLDYLRAHTIDREFYTYSLGAAEAFDTRAVSLEEVSIGDEHVHETER